ncbi:MAG: delta-60 repeat domain-containing protein, partial [Myxococcota bacterium]
RITASAGEVNRQQDVTVTALPLSGSLDYDFGDGGIAVVTVGTLSGAWAGALQTDGKVLLAGTANNDFAIARLDQNGVPDPFFGSAGATTASFGPGVSTCRSVAVQSDGRIVIAGRFTPGPGDENVGVARYEPSGLLDSSFASGGKLSFDFRPNGYSLAQKVEMTSDGKIQVFGNLSIRDAGVAVARVLPNGVLDSSYGVGGASVVELPPPNPFVDDGVLQSDGKSLLCGRAATGGGTAHFSIFRFNLNGGLDPSFGNAGRVTLVPVGATSSGCQSVALQNDGKIVAGGSYYPSSGNAVMFVARFYADGSVDRTLGGSGFVEIQPPAPDTHGFFGALVVLVDGRILAAATLMPSRRAMLTRLMTTGLVDLTFGTGGRSTADVLADGNVTDLLIQADGRYIVMSSTGFRASRFWP